MPHKYLSVFTLLVLLFPIQLFAWGKTGHNIVSEIAVNNLSVGAKQKLLQLLGTTTPEEASVWMDEVRSNPVYDFQKRWHYINIEKGASYVPSLDENIISHITIAYLELLHKETLCPDQAKKDVMILFHLIGDLHQPLHTGYAEDRGGNEIKLQFNEKETNLHWLWDDEIIQQQHISLNDCSTFITSLSSTEIHEIKTIDVVGWMNESRAILQDVYAFKDHKIDLQYAVRNMPVIESQLVKAGLRLSALLEVIFSESPQISNSKDSLKRDIIPSEMIKAGIISANDAINHVGEIATVCGKVFGGIYLEKANGAPTFINMGAVYPNNPFTIVIFGNDRDKFPYKPESFYDTKSICVTGKIKEHKGKAEIVVSDANQD